MATIEQRTNDKGKTKFRVRVRLYGHPKVTATFDRITDAKRWAAQTETAIYESRYFKTPEASKRTFAELVVRYQREVLPFKSENYHFLAHQSKQLDWWKSHLGDYLLKDITASRIVEVRGKLTTVSSSTVNRYMAALSHALSVAVREWEWLDISPISKIRKLKEPRGRVRFLSEEERNRLLEAARAADARLHLVIVLALSTGARKGELLNLLWDDVDLDRRRLIFQKTKNGDRRAASLGSYAFTLLEAYKSVWSHQKFVFQSCRGNPVRVDRDFRAILAQVQIQDFRFHDLRHSAASYLAMSGASMTDIAEILGHKTLAMVKRYTHLSDAHTSKVISRMNESIFN